MLHGLSTAMRSKLFQSLLLLFFVFMKCSYSAQEISSVLSPSTSPLNIVVGCIPADSSHGAVAGTLYLRGTNQPLSGSIIYLAEYVGLETRNPIIILDPSRNLHTKTDRNGHFCFSRVPPGTYGLIVWNAAESVILSDNITGYSMIIKVKYGETQQIGIVYSPIP